MRNIVPEKPVRIGVRNVNMIASESDRCSRDIYIPARPTKLKNSEECSWDHVNYPTL